MYNYNNASYLMGISSEAERSTVNRNVPGSTPGFPAKARMVEQADTTDLKFVSARSVGSSPTLGTSTGEIKCYI